MKKTLLPLKKVTNPSFFICRVAKRMECIGRNPKPLYPTKDATNKPVLSTNILSQ